MKLIPALTASTLMSLAAVVACSQRAAQTSFATPDEAFAALLEAVAKNDRSMLQRLLGPHAEALLDSGDAVADRAARESFVQKFQAEHELTAGGPDALVLQVGDDRWPVPIPLVRHGGRWQFDGASAVGELVMRRIGRNELRTIDVMRGYVQAQEEYASEPRDAAEAGLYARQLRSGPGRHNGLYWDVAAGETPSPAGPLLAAATAEGYAASPAAPYHGYLFRTLLAQGPDANDGARDYLVNGQLREGFALLAYPSQYGVSGVMTFIVNQDGIVWQRDYGADTAKLAGSLATFNPDTGWTPIAPEG